MDFKQAVNVVHLLVEGMGIRAISRFTGLDTKTVLNILETTGQKAAQFLDNKVRNLNSNVIQADEIHGMVYSRQQNTPKDQTERGEQYTFLSVDRESKLIVNWLVGKRTRENAEQFMADLKSRMANRFQLVTDGWTAYTSLDGSVAAVFGQEIDYAAETKYFAKPSTFLPRQLIGMRRRRRIGNPDMKLATTCHAERTNLSVRQFTRRFTRSTLGYSKKLENLRHAVALFVWHFNYVRKHSAHGKTPAESIGLTQRALTISDLLESAF